MTLKFILPNMKNDPVFGLQTLKFRKSLKDYFYHGDLEKREGLHGERGMVAHDRQESHVSL